MASSAREREKGCLKKVKPLLLFTSLVRCWAIIEQRMFLPSASLCSLGLYGWNIIFLSAHCAIILRLMNQKGQHISYDCLLFLRKYFQLLAFSTRKRKSISINFHFFLTRSCWGKKSPSSFSVWMSHNLFINPRDFTFEHRNEFSPPISRFISFLFLAAIKMIYDKLRQKKNHKSLSIVEGSHRPATTLIVWVGNSMTGALERKIDC